MIYVNKFLVFLVGIGLCITAICMPIFYPATAYSVGVFLTSLAGGVTCLITPVASDSKHFELPMPDMIGFLITIISPFVPESKLEKVARNKVELEEELYMHNQDSPYREGLEIQIQECERVIEALVLEHRYERTERLLKRSSKTVRKAIKS